LTVRAKKHFSSGSIGNGEPSESVGIELPDTVCSKSILRADRRLAQRCARGEVKAWEDLYAQCHEPLCTSIRVMLGHGSEDASLVDEIAARVWYALVANDGELLARYDPKRGARLVTFMRALAKDEICRHFRTEFRRRERELVAARGHAHREIALVDPSITSLGEFLDTLTEHERGFCNEYLLAEPPEVEKRSFSAANIWQLSRRVYQKLARYIDRRL
jgi:hypothetical protein